MHGKKSPSPGAQRVYVLVLTNYLVDLTIRQKHMFPKEIGVHTQNMKSILDSIVNMIGRTYVEQSNHLGPIYLT